MKKYLLFIVLIIAMSEIVNGQIRYVTSTGAGLKNGTDWLNAYDNTKLQTAIEEVAVPAVTEVWVAAGTYTPGTLVTSHFSMKNGVAIYGGFAGSELTLSQRNPVANVTILSGEIGKPELKTDNCLSVVYNSDLDNTAILDGFSIQGGYNGIGLGSSGGGIFNHSSSPTINNCTITGNTGSFGAGIYNIGSSPMLTNCIISNNSSRRGGGICNDSSSPTLINCKITFNTASIDGGGVINENLSSPIFINCTIAGNSAVTYGGGVYNTDTAITTLNNSIIWGNGAASGGNQIYAESGSVLLNYSCYADGANNVTSNTGGIFTATNSIVLDPQFVVAGGNDFLIAGNSPCVDAGLDTYNSQENDLRGAGFGRKLAKADGLVGTIDMGAYEYKFGVDPVGSKLFIWTGGTDTDWNTVGNWSTAIVPPSADGVSIPNGAVNYPVIKTTINCYNLTIATGASLTIASTGTITVTGPITNNGTLTIQSDATRTGSLIAGSATGTGTTIAQSYMTAKAWNMVSSPVSGQTIASFLTDPINLTTVETNAASRGMMDYDPSMDMWNSMFTNSTVGNLGAGKGFSLRLQGAADAPVTFTGSLQAGPIAVSTVIDKWNLVGNPYTSAIGINSNASSAANFLTYNASNLDPMYGVYVWDKSYVGDAVTGQYTAISNVPSPTVSDFELQPGKAFMVKMEPTVSGVSFNNMMQIHSMGVVPTKDLWPTIKLSATVNSQKSSTIIAFNSKMTHGLDLTYDAGLFKGGSELAVYTRLVEDNGFSFAIQALPDNEYNTMIIPVGIDSKVGGEVVFSAELFNLPLLWKAILEDKLNNTFNDLSIKAYTATIDPNTSAFDRFQLRTSFVTGNKETLAGQLSVYSIRNTEIRVTGSVSKLAIATLYDIQGKVVLVKNMQEGSLNSIRTPNLKTGIYVLSVNDNQRVQRFKIPVKE